MAGGFPTGWDVCNGISIGQQSTGTAAGTTLTSSGSANTKGSWTQLVASTASDISFVQVTVILITSTIGLVDIGVGSAGNEVVVVNNLIVHDNFDPTVISFPLSIPAGTRISARVQCATASNAVAIAMITYDSSYAQIEGAAGVDSLGANLSTSMGTTVTNGQPGSWTQLTASTARDYQGIFALVDFQNKAASPANTNFPITLDIGIGAAASEIAIIPTAQMITYNSYDQFFPNAPVLYTPVNIPAGTRISARLTSPSGTQTEGVTAYGVYA
jgi:hypothetical protein